MCKILLEAGADVNARGESGYTALMDASGKGHTGVVRILVEAFADVDAYDKNRLTALMLAAMMGHTDVVNFLSMPGPTLT